MAVKENANTEDNDTVSIKIGNKIFSAEKSTLSSYSDYFRVMFSGNFVESGLRVVAINMVSPRDFKLFLDFIEEGKLRWDEINPENMARIFETASMLQITKFIEACEVPLIKEWENFGDAGQMYEFATTYGMNALRRNLLRLLAKCVDVALETGTSEIYFGKGDSRVCNVNSDQVSYEYLAECLSETKTPGEINFGTPVKKYLEKRDRKTTEFPLILEWVCKWLLKFLKDKELHIHAEKIEKLIELCDLEFLSFADIENTLKVCNPSSDIEECNILSLVRECIFKQKARIQSNLKQIGLDFLLISPNQNRRDGVAKCLRCLPILKDGLLTYHYENFQIPFDYIFLVPVDRGKDEEEYACFYSARQFLTLNLATKSMDSIRDIIPPIQVETGILAGGYLVCLGSHDRFWDYTEREHAVLASVNMETSEMTREMVYHIRVPNHFCDSNMVYMDGHFYFVACGPEREDAYKPFLYRYDPERKELEISSQLYRYAKELTKRFRLVVHERQLVIIGRDKLVVINTDCFSKKNGQPLKVLNVHRNGWKIWETFSREGGLYLFCQKNVDYYRDLCVADIFVFRIDLENGILEGLGCVLDVFSNVNHECPEGPPIPCNSYCALNLITKLN